LIRGLGVILRRDIYTFFTNYTSIAFRNLQIVFLILIFAGVLSSVAPRTSTFGLSYQQYFALGAMVVSVGSTSLLIGREIYRDKESGFMDYLLSLPISRWNIIMGRTLGGAIRSILNASLAFIIAAILNPSHVSSIATGLGLLFVLAIGMTGLGILIASTIVKQTRWRVVIALVEVILIRTSTTYYPRTAMPFWLKPTTSANPLTQSADVVISIVSGGQTADIVLNVVNMLVFSIVASLLGIWLYARIIEGKMFEL